MHLALTVLVQVGSFGRVSGSCWDVRSSLLRRPYRCPQSLRRVAAYVERTIAEVVRWEQRSGPATAARKIISETCRQIMDQALRRMLACLSTKALPNGCSPFNRGRQRRRFHGGSSVIVDGGFCAGFSDIGIRHVATVSGRCSRSAKARSRGRLSAGGAAGSMAIVLEHGASDDERRTPRDRWCDHIGEPDRCQSRWTVVAIDRVARSRGCSSRLDAIEAACRRCRPTASTKFAQ